MEFLGYCGYKGNHRIVLMAVVNLNYQFTLVDIGDAGRQSNRLVFSASNLGFGTNNDKLSIPPPREVTAFHKNLPYIFIAIEAFPHI